VNRVHGFGWWLGKAGEFPVARADSARAPARRARPAQQEPAQPTLAATPPAHEHEDMVAKSVRTFKRPTSVREVARVGAGR
jgi:hypothetical protein